MLNVRVAGSALVTSVKFGVAEAAIDPHRMHLRLMLWPLRSNLDVVVLLPPSMQGKLTMLSASRINVAVSKFMHAKVELPLGILLAKRCVPGPLK